MFIKASESVVNYNNVKEIAEKIRFYLCFKINFEYDKLKKVIKIIFVIITNSNDNILIITSRPIYSTKPQFSVIC